VLAVVRIVGLLVAVALIVTVGAWLLTGERRWLRLAWNIFRASLFASVLILLLFAAEALLE
jgi:type IV secretory pathway VirB2 component (pilin)